MSLTHKAGMTPEKIAASNQANDQLSNGHAMPAGMERMCDAEKSHSFYSPAGRGSNYGLNEPLLTRSFAGAAHIQAPLMPRSENSNPRKMESLTSMLMRIEAARTPALTAAAYTQYGGISHDVDENKGPLNSL